MIGTQEKSRGVVGLLWWVLALMCGGGGVLWALSPLGVRLSEIQFKTPDVFWKLFPSAPLLMFIGLIGLRLWKRGSLNIWGKIAFYACLLGAVLIVVGDFGKFYLLVDDVYLMTAPFYRTMRAGFLLLTAACMLFGVFAARSGKLSPWVALPFAICSLAGFISVIKDLHDFGMDLWIAFGAGWIWLGIGLVVEGIATLLRRRKKS